MRNNRIFVALTVTGGVVALGLRPVAADNNGQRCVVTSWSTPITAKGCQPGGDGISCQGPVTFEIEEHYEALLVSTLRDPSCTGPQASYRR